MSFDLMRRHRRKVEVPLAIFVVITFVLFFGISGIDKVAADWQRSKSSSTSEEEGRLLALGRDLALVGLMAEPPKEAWDGDDYGRQIRRRYTEAVRMRYEAPLRLADEMGIRASDEDLIRELNQRLRRPPWNLEPLKPGESPKQYVQRYEKLLAGRNISKQRFEELLRGQMVIERLQQMVSSAGAASEAEMYRYYAEVNRKVRVQYFQRRTADFVKTVEEAAKLEAAEAAKPAEPAAPAKDEEKTGGEGKGDKKDGAAAVPAKPERKGVSDEDVKERFDNEMNQLKSMTPRPGQSWDSRLLQKRPEYFSGERARLEYLVALREKFAKDIAIEPKDIEKYYKDNEYKYREETKPEDPAKAKDKDAKDADAKDAKAGGEAEPSLKPLDDKLRAEISKILVERKALEKAEAALKAAVKEYNDAAPEDRPVLGALAAKHKLETTGTSILAERENLEALPYLKDVSCLVDQAFDESSRRQLGGQFTEPTRTRTEGKDQEPVALVTLRVAEFEPSKLLDFDQVKAAVRERLVVEKALKLAREAAEADLKLLVEGKLDPKLVHTSDILEPGSEACQQTADLAVGEASKKPYAYSELLGEEAAAEKEKEKQKEKDKDNAKKGEKPAIADSYPKGYRAVILAERIVPTIDEFHKDQAWSKQWKPEVPSWISSLPEGFREDYIRQMIGRSPDNEWRESYLSGWIMERCEKAEAAAQ